MGVHQNLTHAVHPDPVSGHHCWLQKAINVRKAEAHEKHGDVWVDTEKSMAVYREWVSMARSAADYSPNGERRPYWLKRPLKPVRAAYRLNGRPSLNGHHPKIEIGDRDRAVSDPVAAD